MCVTRRRSGVSGRRVGNGAGNLSRAQVHNFVRVHIRCAVGVCYIVRVPVSLASRRSHCHVTPSLAQYADVSEAHTLMQCGSCVSNTASRELRRSVSVLNVEYLLGYFPVVSPTQAVEQLTAYVMEGAGDSIGFYCLENSSQYP